jgi:flagellar basal body P-ring formation protein FlgA
VLNRLPSALLACATATAAAAELGPGQVEIGLRPDVTATHRTIVLDEIASLRTTDLQMLRRLMELPLGEAPRPGSEALLKRERLAHWIRSRVGIAPEQLVWKGAEQTQVRTAIQRLGSQPLEEVARTALQQWLQPRTSRFSVETARAVQEVSLPPGKVAITARALPANAQPTSHMVVWVDVSVDGAFIRAVPVNFQVEAFREAWVVSDTIAAGTPLTGHLLKARELPVMARPVALVAPKGTREGGSIQSVRRLHPGEPVTEENTQKLAAVRRGDMVSLQFRAGPVQLEGRAKALQEGEIGELVRVRMTGAAVPVHARVIEPGRVEAMP